MDNDYLVLLGGEVKAKSDGRVEGYLVLFGDADNPDLEGDFFTPETDFGLADGAKSAVWYRHALDPTLDRKLADGELKADQVGVWVEAQLNLRDRYERALWKMANEGKLGWSSGTAAHLVRREEQEGGAQKIVRWPLGLDASLTPDPAEPRTQALTVKSIQWQAPPLTELAPEEMEIKAHLGDYVAEDMTMAALRTLNDRLFYSALYKLCYEEETSPADRASKMAEAFDEFRDVAVATVGKLLGADAEGTRSALKALWGPAVPEALADHSAKVVSAAAGFADRLESRLEARIATGRALSEGNCKALADVLAALSGVDAVKERLALTLKRATTTDEGDPDAQQRLRRLRLETEQVRTRALAAL